MTFQIKLAMIEKEGTVRQRFILFLSGQRGVGRDLFELCLRGAERFEI